MRNAEWNDERRSASDLSLQFRIPHSAFRIVLAGAPGAAFQSRKLAGATMARALPGPSPSSGRRPGPRAAAAAAALRRDRAVRRPRPRGLAIAGQHTSEMGGAERVRRGRAAYRGDHDETRLR